MLQTLTPRQIISYATELGLHNGTPAKRKQMVEELLDTFHLHSCSETVVGVPGEKRGISGGERKRVSIAMSLVNEPSLVFIDEPTSGLDSSAAENVVAILRNLANAGKTVVCCIHQPSQQILNQFTHILLMARGKVVYYGPREKVAEHFGAIGIPQPSFVNTAAWLIDLVDTNYEPIEVIIKNEANPAPVASSSSNENPTRKRKHKHKKHKKAHTEEAELEIRKTIPTLPRAHSVELVEHLIAAYSASPLGMANKAACHSENDLVPFDEVPRPYARSQFMQMFILSRRAAVSLFRDRAFIISRLMQTLIIGVIVAILFQGTKNDQVGVRNRLGFMFCAQHLLILH